MKIRAKEEVGVKVDRHYTRRQTWTKEAAPGYFKVGVIAHSQFLKGNVLRAGSGG
ncbi:MAG: hypothetical protein OEW95_11675 [Candidatus Bathyarchaeota archaeon]|nr:hypothetical protein [Candidatus Bathyarchaeota archaeon]